LLKHHIKPHWLQRVLLSFIVNKSDHQVLHLLKLLWVYYFMHQRYLLLCTFLCFEKCNCLLIYFLAKASEGSF
jgi:hypothetical protein